MVGEAHQHWLDHSKAGKNLIGARHGRHRSRRDKTAHLNLRHASGGNRPALASRRSAVVESAYGWFCRPSRGPYIGNNDCALVIHATVPSALASAQFACNAQIEQMGHVKPHRCAAPEEGAAVNS